MNKTIKSLAMVAIALFDGFASSSAQEDEGVELNKDMFHIWDGLTKDALPTDEKVYMDWNFKRSVWRKNLQNNCQWKLEILL